MYISHKQRLGEMEIPGHREENYKLFLKYVVVPKPKELLKE